MKSQTAAVIFVVLLFVSVPLALAQQSSLQPSQPSADSSATPAIAYSAIQAPVPAWVRLRGSGSLNTLRPACLFRTYVDNKCKPFKDPRSLRSLCAKKPALCNLVTLKPCDL